MDLVSGSIRPTCASSPRRNNAAFVIGPSSEFGNFTKQSYPRETWFQLSSWKEVLIQESLMLLLSALPGISVKKKKKKIWSKARKCATRNMKNPHSSASTAQPQGVRWFSYCGRELFAEILGIYLSAPISPKTPQRNGWRGSLRVGST